MKSDPVPAAHQAPSDYKILGLGTIVVDHVAEVRSLPEPDTKTDILSSHYQVGGPVVTALALLSKWGYTTSFIGCWSTDELGERIEEDLIKSQIQSGFASVHPSHQSGHAHVWVEASTGRRSIAAFRGRGSLDWAELEHLSWSEWKALHLDGSHGEVATLAAREMKKHGGIVTMDLGSPKPNLPKLLEHVDALQCPAGLLTQLYPDQSDIEAARCLLDLGPREITVTMGSEGALWLNRNEQRHQRLSRLRQSIPMELAMSLQEPACMPAIRAGHQSTASNLPRRVVRSSASNGEIEKPYQKWNPSFLYWAKEKVTRSSVLFRGRLRRRLGDLG